ncbi:MAG: DUF983 domain-containing protein [Gemmatimonadota bacterium]|nr:DUF983 domain-containing protein [Gemmatimonadota bacterium]
MWRTTLRHRCPACGEGRIFASGYRLHTSCPACGLDLLGRHGAHYGGPIALGYSIGGITGIVVFTALFLRFGFEAWVVWVSVGAVVVSILLTFRHCKAWWTWGLYRTGQIGGRRHRRAVRDPGTS